MLALCLADLTDQGLHRRWLQSRFLTFSQPRETTKCCALQTRGACVPRNGRRRSRRLWWLASRRESRWRHPSSPAQDSWRKQRCSAREKQESVESDPWHLVDNYPTKNVPSVLKYWKPASRTPSTSVHWFYFSARYVGAKLRNISTTNGENQAASTALVKNAESTVLDARKTSATTYLSLCAFYQQHLDASHRNATHIKSKITALHRYHFTKENSFNYTAPHFKKQIATNLGNFSGGDCWFCFRWYDLAAHKLCCGIVGPSLISIVVFVAVIVVVAVQLCEGAALVGNSLRFGAHHRWLQKNTLHEIENWWKSWASCLSTKVAEMGEKGRCGLCGANTARFGLSPQNLFSLRRSSIV